MATINTHTQMQVYWKTKRYTKSQDIAAKPNEHFSLV